VRDFCRRLRTVGPVVAYDSNPPASAADKLGPPEIFALLAGLLTASAVLLCLGARVGKPSGATPRADLWQFGSWSLLVSAGTRSWPAS